MQRFITSLALICVLADARSRRPKSHNDLPEEPADLDVSKVIGRKDRPSGLEARIGGDDEKRMFV